jgi:hypothetical protein
MREDYTEEDVEYYFNYSGILAERGSYDTLEDLIKCELHDLGRQALACAFCRHNLSCSMYVYVNRSLLACGQMPTSQLEHLNALWAFAADLQLICIVHLSIFCCCTLHQHERKHHQKCCLSSQHSCAHCVV